jgi:pimeloyl-ACP methyl ester carboxylesterase
MSYRPFARLIVLVALALALAQPAFCLPDTGMWKDPPSSLRPAASMDEISIVSHGDRMNGFIYEAAGSGPHPVVIFLHGFPGNERNLDLAQAVRRAGFQAIYFDYRGNWGSAGTFSFAHGLEDVAAVLDWVRAPENRAKYHFDSSRIAIIGHSYGGWLTLMTASHQPANVCVAALAAWNAGWAAKRFSDHPEERAARLEFFRAAVEPAGAPIHAEAAGLLDEMSAGAEAFDYVAQAPSLKERVALLVGATHDSLYSGAPRLQQLADKIHEAGGRQVKLVIYDDDHAFSSPRVALTELLVHWLKEDCAKAWRRSKAGDGH